MSSYGHLTPDMIRADPEYTVHPNDLLAELERVYGKLEADELWYVTTHVLDSDS